MCAVQQHTTQLVLETADEAAAVIEFASQLTTYPSRSDGKPTEAEARQLIASFNRVCEKWGSVARWTRTATSVTSGWDIEEVCKSFQRFRDTVDPETLAQFEQQANNNAGRAIDHRSTIASL